MAKCPKCERAIFTARLSAISIPSGTTTWVGVAYSCPSCDVVLSVGIDPIALKTDIVDEVLSGLRKG